MLRSRFVSISAVFFCLAIAAALITVSAVPAWGQATSTGTIVGTVTDNSGAVVAGATVTATDRATGDSRSTTTNDVGHYIFPNVNPSTYTIKFKKAGFAELVVANATVQVGTQLTENVQMKLGSVSTTVTVTETAGAELQTMNSTIGNTISGTQLDSLPAIGRDVSTFAVLQPGVSPDGSVAGAVVDQSTFALDGGNNTNDMDGSMQVYTPSFANDVTGGIVMNQIGAPPTGVLPTPVDSVEEVKINTANQTADFNNSSGSQVEVVTKRGTNNWHGTAYEYYLDNNFSGNTWDNNFAGTPVPSYHFNRFGFAGGGPVIPKSFLGGKTYFFGNYEGFRWPQSATINRVVPTAAMRTGTLTFGGTSYNLINYDPRGASGGLVDNGINPLVQQLWNTYLPLPNATCGPIAGAFCDDVNEARFTANMLIPQRSDFGVARLDHDFGSKWHFMSSYRVYRLLRATTSQVDIGGFFPGDTLGVPASLSNRPQQPWYYVAGLTTNISPNVTNDFHYSYLRNFWAWESHNAPPQLAGASGALEPFGESATNVLAPYNVNTQSVRTRFWDGQDNFLRDDVTVLHGNHLFQFGGQYQRNWNYHQRTDNGGGINFTLTYQLGDSAGAGRIDMTPVGAMGFPVSKNNNRDYAAVVGLVTDSQIAYTRSGPNLALNPPLTPASDQSTIPYYNVYFGDSWHLKPSLTLSYGLGWTLEMPPTEAQGKQVELVDASNQQIDLQAYLFQRQRAALQGQVYNPPVGFALVGNTGNHQKYPYNPFYGSFSPRVAVAWNPSFDSGSFMGRILGQNSSVIRGGYSRIYGRLNGVDLVLVPLLGTGLIQPVQCRQAFMNGACGPTNPDASNAFRIGIDGPTAPLAAAAPTLPQPDFPGINAAAAGAGEALDPNFRPNAVDSFDLTIQRQFGPKLMLEVGYIGRRITHEYQPININAVPYMMTLGGQTFAQAYAAVETAMGCTTSAAACGANPTPTVASQPFFEAALAGTGYCTPGTCTSTVVANEFSNFASQSVWSLWSDLDTGGVTPGFNFPVSMLNTAGQLSSGVGVNASVGYGNYNGAFVSLKTNDWHGLTTQQNFTFSKALGTGAFVQATSEYTVVDPFDLKEAYGLQNFDRKLVYNLEGVYNPPFHKGQQGLVGRLLGGWSFAPVLAVGSGAPVLCNVYDGGGFTGGTGAQGFGAGDGANFFDNEQCLFTKQPSGISAHVGVPGSGGVGVDTSDSGLPNYPIRGAEVNLFANPEAVYNTVRPPILGVDKRAGGVGPIRGLPYWNVDFSVTKDIRLTERFGIQLQSVFTNVFNHNQFFDPLLDLTNVGSWGVLNAQGNNPRQIQLGARINF
ncbi:MAG TPA: carboxypeptidase-like regulatory domain-containing protein [Candidatus Acidoferrales bacterium]|nr:carboxypeptidase-like regulatory domain-containing protein [Candidatus Acidoferrales bacterium]